MKIATLTASLILGLSGTTALAQTATTDWYLAPTIGVTMNDGSRASNTGMGVGLVVGKMLNSRWNVEVGGQYLRLDGSRDRQGSVGVDGLFFFNRNANFAPYAVVGLGMAREGGPTGHNDNLLLKAGLGFTKQLNRTTDLRADIRYQEHKNKDRAAGGGRLGDTVISVGANFAFGR